MRPDRPYLSLAPLGARDEDEQSIVLVEAMDALALCRRGEYERVDARATAWQFDRMSGSLTWEMGLFLSRMNWLRAAFVTEENHPALIARAIASNELVGVRWTAQGSGELDPSVEQRKVARAVETRTRGRLSEGGRHYKLVPGLDLDRLPDRDAYQVVPCADARRVLDELAGAADPELATLLKKAAELLTPDWRPPFRPDGLVCLRRLRAPTVSTGSSQPALTPSQLWGKAKEDSDIIDWTIWIELDPDDPKASDDVVILIDEFHQEVMRKPLAACPRQGGGVLVVFKEINKHQRFSLIRDYGPNEGGGADTLFIDSSPAEMDERGSKTE
jgi:hypothetical protein